MAKPKPEKKRESEGVGVPVPPTPKVAYTRPSCPDWIASTKTFHSVFLRTTMFSSSPIRMVLPSITTSGQFEQAGQSETTVLSVTDHLLLLRCLDRLESDAPMITLEDALLRGVLPPLSTHDKSQHDDSNGEYYEHQKRDLELNAAFDVRPYHLRARRFDLEPSPCAH